jgi:ABC-type glycerol-3-phosphate transport system substrate-binding protein
MTRLHVVMEDIPDSHLVRALTADFHRAHPAIEVAVEPMHYDFMLDRVLAAIGDPGAPNGVVIFDNPWTHDWVRGGLIRPVDDLLSATPELAWDDFAPALRAAAGMDGRTWGVPFYTWSFGLIYRADLYEAHGLRPPRTLDELAANAAALTTPERAGMAMQPRADYNAAEEWCNHLFAAGGSVQTAAGAVVMDSPEARTALRTYADVFARSAPAGSAEWTFEDSITALAGGRAAQMINCHWWLPVLNAPDGPAGELAGRYRLAEIPGGTGILGVWYWAIPAAANPAQAEAAWTFISWIASRAANVERVARGGSPVRTSTMRDPQVWERAFGRDYYETVGRMHESARPLMHGANAEEATRVIGAAVHDVVTGARDVDTAVTQAAAGVAELLGRADG